MLAAAIGKKTLKEVKVLQQVWKMTAWTTQVSDEGRYEGMESN